MKTDVVTALKQAGTGDRSRVRAGLVIVQVSLSTALLVVAAVLVRSAMAPGTAARGFSTSHVLMAVVNLTGYTPERGTAFYRHLQERLDADTGVIASNVLDVIPIAMNRPVMPVELRADNGTATANSDVERVYINNVSPGHFRTLQIPVLHGRDFTVADDAHSKPVCVINQTLAQRFWHGENPVGSHVQTAGGPWIEVIGVARDSKYLSLDEPPRAFLYRPLAQQYASTATILIKASGDLEAAAASLRREISVLEPNLLAYSVQPLEDRIALTLLPNRAAATLAGILGLVGLILGLIGTYGTMSFIVQQRRREIGVRMALGATPGNVVALITRQGMKWTGTGLFAGSAAALAACLLLRRLMFGIVPADPISFLGITSLLAATAYIACYVPARRASHTDPLAALREE